MTFLFIPDPPKIFKPPVSQIKNETQDINVSCILEGKPRPVVTWFKDGVKLVTDNRMTFVNVNSTWYLTIVNLRRGDGGLYTCEATNYVGTEMSRPGTLDVYCKCPSHTLNDLCPC